VLLQFNVVSDNSIWITDTQFLNWARVSAPGTDPESKVLESGKLTPKGFGIYGLEGRTPKDGLTTIGTYVVGIGSMVKIFLRANVEVKDFTMPAPIRQILYEILPADPKQIEHAIQEMTDDPEQGQQEPEPPGPQEPAVKGGFPEAAAGEEQPEAEAGVELGDGDVESSTNSERVVANEFETA
jgi:hypothetical protein